MTNYLLVHVPGCELFTIAADGVFLPKPRRQRLGLVIPVGSRKDVLLRCPQPGLFVADSSRQDPADQTMISEFLGTHTNFYEGEREGSTHRSRHDRRHTVGWLARPSS